MTRKKPTKYTNYTDNVSVPKALLIFAVVLFGVGIVHVLSTPTVNTAQSNTGTQSPSQQPQQAQQPTTVTIPPAAQQKLEQQAMPSLSSPSGTEESDGFDAGYNYAEQYQICDPNYDNGNSQDFNDGVNAWTSDNCTDGQINDNSSQ